MAILRRLLRINLNKIDSDFILLSKRFKNKKLLFIDLGCRGENPKYWPKDSKYIKYIGIDASNSVIKDLERKYFNYKGNVDASFINAIVSNNNSEQLFASSYLGMTDGIIIENDYSNISAKDIKIRKVKPVSLVSLLNKFMNFLNDDKFLKILKIDIEGNSSSIVNDKELIRNFDIVLAELLPQMKKQYHTMTLLEENDFQLQNIERAFRWSKKSSKELFILDTEWLNKNSKIIFEKNNSKYPNIILRSFSLIIFLLIRILFKLVRGKAYSSLSDSELGW